MRINIRDIIKDDLTSIKDIWIVLKKETAGPTPAVSFVSIPNDTVEYELSDDIVSEHKEIQLKVWFVIDGKNNIKFYNIKSSTIFNTSNISTSVPDQIKHLIKDNTSSKLQRLCVHIINFINSKTDTQLIQKQQLSEIVLKAKCVNDINDKILGSKNLIYYSAYDGPMYLDLLNLSILTLLKHNSIDKFDILIITDKHTKTKIEKLNFVEKKRPLYLITKTPKDGVEASINKVKIFEYNKINDYQNILYLDCDTACKSSIDGIFDDIKPNVLYTAHGYKVTNLSIFKTLTYGFETVDDEFVDKMKDKEQYPFNAGQFLFKNSIRMQGHFKNLNYFIKNWRGRYFFEQGFMNYYFCGAEITDNKHLDKFIGFCSPENPIPKEAFKPITHFAGSPLKGFEKISLIANFVDRDIFDSFLSLKTIPEKTISESGGNWTITEKNKILDFSKYDIHGFHNMEMRPWIPDIGLLELKDGIINDDIFPCVLEKKELYPILGLTIYGGKDFRDRVAAEANWMLDRQKLYYKSIDKCDKIDKRSGKALMLYSTWSIHNYCHFLLDTLSRLDILKSLNIKLESYDWVCLPLADFKIYEKIIEKLNIDKNKIIFLKYAKNINYQFDTLHIPSMNGRIQIYSDTAFKEIRSLLKIKDSNPNCKRKIYLKRLNDRRSFYNVKEVEDLLMSYGFEFIEAENEDDIVSIMQESQIIVSAHGAGLSNILFCPIETNIIELMPEFWQKQYYMSLANSIGLNYSCIMCKDSSNEPLPSKQVLFGDTIKRLMVVDIEILKKYIEKHI